MQYKLFPLNKLSYEVVIGQKAPYVALKVLILSKLHTRTRENTRETEQVLNAHLLVLNK